MEGPAQMSARVAVVTGASAGIGRATAVAFAHGGWRVALLARGRAGLEGARRDVEAAGGQALVVPLDVTDAEAVFAAADQIVEASGRLDVWVNNAMATAFGPADRVPPDEWKPGRRARFRTAGCSTEDYAMRSRPPWISRCALVLSEMSSSNFEARASRDRAGPPRRWVVGKE